MQLDACLRSFYMHCLDVTRCKARVIYTCSTERHKSQYEVLQSTYDAVEFICESVFYSDLVTALDGFEHVLFLVDDNIFVRRWTFHETLEALDKNPSSLGFSLRLGRNTTHCYSLNRPQSLPEFSKVCSRILNFRWVDSDNDFGYPFEVSSSIFRTEQLLPILSATSAIRSPNTLEAWLNGSKNSFKVSHPNLLCFVDSVAFCNPANLVQTDHYNRSSADTKVTAHHLMRMFDLGYRIDISRLTDFVPSACHQEIDFEYQAPMTQWDSIYVTVELHPATVSASCRAGSANTHETRPETSIASKLDIASLPDAFKVEVLEFVHLVEASGRLSNGDWLLDVLKGITSATESEQIEASRILDILKMQLEEIQKREDDWYRPELARYQRQLEEIQKREDDWYRPELARYQKELTEVHEELSKSQAELDKSQAELDKSQAEIGRIKNSRAWKVTQKVKFVHSSFKELFWLFHFRRR